MRPTATRPIAVTGDLMFEVVRSLDELPPHGGTTIVDFADGVPGGSAFNVAADLAQLEVDAALITIVGGEEIGRVRDELSRHNLDPSGVITRECSSDRLLAFVSPHDNRSFYLRGRLGPSSEAELGQRLADYSVLVFTGSRHPAWRAVVAAWVDRIGGSLILAPSYALYSQTAAETEALLRRSSVLVLNEAEAVWTERALGRTLRAIASVPAGPIVLITRADRGAILLEEDAAFELPSLSGRSGDVLGAGDAFLAGLLLGRSWPLSWVEAARLASVVAGEAARQGIVRPRLSRDLLVARYGLLPTDAMLPAEALS